MDQKSEKLSTEFFTHLYVSLLPHKNTISNRLADDFFINCSVSRTHDLGYVCNHVIVKFFEHYLTYIPTIDTKDFFYIVSFPNFPMVKNINPNSYKGFMRIFVEVMTEIVKYVMDDVVIQDISDNNGLQWKVYKEEQKTSI